MAVMYLYNDFLAPICPHWYHEEGDYGDGGDHLIYKLNDEFYMVHTGMSSGIQFTVDTSVSPSMLWFPYSETLYKLVEGKWVREAEDVPAKIHITEAKNIIWSSLRVYAIKIDGLMSVAQPTYMEGTEAVPIDGEITGIEISASKSVKLRDFCIISVTVGGTGNFTDSVTYSLEGATSVYTTLVKTKSGNSYILRCGEDETADKLTLRFASVQNTSFIATKTISVQSRNFETLATNRSWLVGFNLGLAGSAFPYSVFDPNQDLTKIIEVDGLWASTLPTTATLYLVDDETYVNDDTSVTYRIGESSLSLKLNGAHLIVEA